MKSEKIFGVNFILKLIHSILEKFLEMKIENMNT